MIGVGGALLLEAFGSGSSVPLGDGLLLEAFGSGSSVPLGDGLLLEAFGSGSSVPLGDGLPLVLLVLELADGSGLLGSPSLVDGEATDVGPALALGSVEASVEGGGAALSIGAGELAVGIGVEAVLAAVAGVLTAFESVAFSSPQLSVARTNDATTEK